ncbi:MAG: hypothetical protein V3W20_08335 [Candidatus Neomarinimicrobiota bacterium]
MIEAIIPTRHDTGLGRFYEHDGIMIPSVTTVMTSISKGIGYDKWLGNYSSYTAAMDYASSRADRGERIHINCNALIYGLPVDTKGMEIDEILCLQAFKDWVDLVNPEFLYSELSMWHPDYFVAGTADIICKIKGQLFLIDIKTTKSHWDTHGVQLTGYGRLYEKIYSEKPELSVLKLSVGRGNIPKYDAKRYGYSDDALKYAYGLWTWMYPNTPKPRKPIVIPKIIQLEQQIITLPEDEYVKEPI